MTEKLYYENPGQTEFSARILGIEKDKKGWKVVLDRTCFYPEGGGQPADRGTINGISVIDVQKENGKIFHYLNDKPENDHITGKVDWDHRFDYMQQHTGQHILSGVLKRMGDFDTVSVHQGEEYTTIEIAQQEIAEEEIYRAEDLANEIINRNIPVEAVWTTSDKLDAFPLRREAKVTGKVRIIRIDDIDCVACGGLHTATTGEVGLVKNIGTERIRGRVRLVWKIGKRAYRDYRQKTEIISRLIDMFSARLDDLIEKIEKQQEELVKRARTISELQKRLAEMSAGILCEKAVETPSGNRIVVGRMDDIPMDSLRKAAIKLAEEDSGKAVGVYVCLLGIEGERINWCLSVSEGLDLPFDRIRRELLPVIGGKGGGKYPLWQGIGEKIEGLNLFLENFKEIINSMERDKS